MPTFRSLDDADVKGKRVLLRVDLNVPMQNGKVADATRIEEIAPTINELAGKGQPAAQTVDPNNKKKPKAPPVDKNDESSSKKKPKKGLDKLNPF